MKKSKVKIVVTGAGGLLGWHATVRLHASNCSSRFRGAAEPYEIVPIDHLSFENDARLAAAVTDADAVLHFAGVNRAPDDVIESANPAIAQRLTDACASVDSKPHVVYANSTHSASDTPYGRSKRHAGEILQGIGGRYSDLVLPHVFGEGARPRYNNVTATFVEAIIAGVVPKIDVTGQLALLHAGTAAQAAIDAVNQQSAGELYPQSRPTLVPELYERLLMWHKVYMANTFPDLRDLFDVSLFNSYRAALYPGGFPRPLKLHTDSRGMLFEAVKGGGGGQTFASWTLPRVTRGDHFHLNKVERFLVVQGEAVIRIRPVFRQNVWAYRVSGETPAVVDMPTLHTHSIENVGNSPLLTLFWTNDQFSTDAPDTYGDPVLGARV